MVKSPLRFRPENNSGLPNIHKHSKIHERPKSPRFAIPPKTSKQLLKDD